MAKKKQYYIRKAHRYLGVVIGIQFLLWTLGGMYFSWTDIDEIHGDHFQKTSLPPSVTHLKGLGNIDSTLEIQSLELRFIKGEPYFWVNNQQLFHARTGVKKDSISEAEAISITSSFIKDDYTVRKVQYLMEVSEHHEYRGRPLPAWEIHYDSPQNLIAYVSARDGSFQRVRHRSWRWFDFLWMLHTMDYQGRDDMNNWVLRGFSLLGMMTVLSGFALFFFTRKKRKKAWQLA